MLVIKCLRLLTALSWESFDFLFSLSKYCIVGDKHSQASSLKLLALIRVSFGWLANI